ncbi:tetratricopeptide repeat protein [Desulfogranum mediterraneum]|uniref:tetratricopeptide repeat protein n=1 Tax=Desulfogranum mediterraneum TaxID=160661 RepID=UPI000417DFF6|nr:tetratricopeptide repeat protein [Desulfogranum mediterraneum]
MATNRQQQQQTSRQTLYISIIASLLIGFVGGVFYSSMQVPATTTAQKHDHPEDNTALLALEKRTQANPKDGEAWTRLGHAYFDIDEYAKAIHAYEQALRISPDNTNTLTDLGVMYRRNGQPDRAIASFDRVLGLDPNHEQARFNKGVVLLNDFKDTPGAIGQWKELLARKPGATAPSGTPLAEIIDQLERSGDGREQ